MRARDPHEVGRTATPLELLFDLVFVVAVASAATQLHHGLIEGHYDAVTGYLLTWFAIWWAWVNYTWFASAFDNDDVVFRILTFVIMAGALFLAAGVPDIFDDGQSQVVVLGYAVMRFAMVGLWLRASAGHPGRRATALTYATGIAIVQVFWIARLWAPQSWWVWSFAALVVAELAVPFLAERSRGYTPFHTHHLAERYGLMTIIVLGEVILSAVVAIQGAMASAGEPTGGGGHAAPLVAGSGGIGWAMAPLILGGLLLVFSMWWCYFASEHAELLEGPVMMWVFGYGHYAVFAAIAAIGAALAAAVDVIAQGTSASVQPVAVTLAAGISIAVLALGAMHAAMDGAWRRGLLPPALVSGGCFAVALLVSVMGWAVLLMGVALAGLAAHKVRLGLTQASTR